MSVLVAARGLMDVYPARHFSIPGAPFFYTRRAIFL
jgi:hypothetical protein